MAPRIPGVTPYKQSNAILPAQAVAGGVIAAIPGALTSSATADVVNSSRENVNSSVAANRRVTQAATESLANAAGMPRAFVQAGNSVDLGGLANAGAKLAETFQTINRQKLDTDFALKAEALLQDSQDIITRQDGGLITFQRKQNELVDAYRNRVSPEVLMPYIQRLTNTATTINREVISATAKAAQESAEIQQNKEVQEAVWSILPSVIGAASPYASPAANQAAFAEIDKFFDRAMNELSPSVAMLAITDVVEAVIEVWKSDAPQLAAKKQELFNNAIYFSEMRPVMQAVEAGTMTPYDAAAKSAEIAAKTGAELLYELPTFQNMITQQRALQEAAREAQQLWSDTQAPITLEDVLSKVIQANGLTITTGGLYYADNPADFGNALAQLKIIGIDIEKSPSFSAMQSIAENVTKFREEEPQAWGRVQGLVAASRLQGARNAEDMQQYATSLQRSTLDLLTSASTLGNSANMGQLNAELKARGLGFASPEEANNFLLSAAQEYARLDIREPAARQALLQKYNDTLAVFTSVATAEVRNALTTYENTFSRYPDLSTRDMLKRSGDGRYQLTTLRELDKNYMTPVQSIYGTITETRDRLAETRRLQEEAGTTQNFQ